MEENRNNNEKRPDDEGYNPEIDGYYPDSVSDAADHRTRKSRRVDEEMPPFENGRDIKNTIKSKGYYAVSVIGIICGGISLLLSFAAFLFAGVYGVGIIINSFAVLMGIAGTAVSSFGISMARRNSSYDPRISITGAVFSFLALSIACMMFFFTGCTACVCAPLWRPL